jgi:serine/threonine protein kinase
MNPAVDPVTPDQFGPYEVYERLGMGGMAQVHRAKKRGPAGFERSVALKRMLSHLAEDRSFVESFIREAKVVSMLVHPNIAQIYDFGRIGGIYYIAMELCGGYDLRKLLRYANRANEPIPLAVVLSILGELCDALEYAHNCVDEQGTRLNIVHRDISPSNMIVAHTGHLKVIDFGIAKATSRQLHTESGQVKGKLGYMSPEAAVGMSSGATSDVFSMGVVAWELVTASPLFSARTDFETMRKIREAEVAPPSRHNPGCPPELDRLILHALERAPERRLPTAGAFRRGLDAIAHRYGLQVSARTVGEWIRQFQQPDDHAGRPSGRTPPPEYAMLRPSAQERLQRSHDEIALATEIWGEDAHTQAPPDGPDFSIADMAGHMPTLNGLSLNAGEVRIAPNTSPRAADLQLTAPQRPRSGPMASIPQSGPMAPMPYGHPSAPHLTPQGYPPSPQQPHRRGAVAIGALAFVAAVAGGVVILKSTRGSKQTPPAAPPPATGSQVAMVAAPDAAAPAVAPPHEPVVVAPHDPIVAPDAAIDEVVETTEPHPGHHSKHTPRSTPKHVEHAAPVYAAVVETPPPPKPDASLVVQKPAMPPPPPPPQTKPARTPVVAASLVHKVSGELPTIRGDVDGDALVKMCIDESGAVSSVRIVRASSQMPPDLTRALQGWRYQPYLNKDGKASPVCFALSLRVDVKSSD